MNITRTHAILGAILLVSTALHLFRIARPAHPVFDEKHFATYAADYATGRAHLDIHPPLGKELYAAVLVISGGMNVPGQFVELRKNAVTGAIDALDTHQPFGNFPYVSLRIISAAFGVLLILAVFFFVRSIGGSDDAALLAALLLAFENGILLQTRLMLLDGMYLAFGFFALATYFKRKRFSIFVSGILLGCALAVKLVAVVFLAPVIAAWAIARFRKESFSLRPLIQFAGIGLAVLTLFYAANGFFFSPQSRIANWQSLGIFASDANGQSTILGSGKGVAYLQATVAEVLYSFGGYLGTPSRGSDATLASAGPNESPWYLWPWMQRSILYDNQGSTPLVFIGNPAVWLGATFAICVALVGFLGRARKKLNDASKNDTLTVLIAGYVGALLPFATIVSRTTFIYHYLPALIFGICAAAYFLTDVSGLVRIRPSSGKERIALLAVCGAVVLGFALAAPFTYASF